jgi:hypothetical protein
MSVEDLIVEDKKKKYYRWRKTVPLKIAGWKDGVPYIFPVFRYHFASKY